MKKEKSNPLFAVAADNWKDQVLVLTKRSNYKQVVSRMNKVIDEFGHKKIQNITKEDIQKFIVKLSESVGTETIRHYLAVIKGVMEYADDEWDMPTRLKLPKAKKPSQPFYTFEEVRKMLHHASGVEKVMIMVMAETGCRYGELVALQPADVYDCKIHITKNVYDGVLQYEPKTDSSIRTVCISSRLEQEIKNLCLSNPKSFIFRSPSGDRAYWPHRFLNILMEVCKNSGIEYKGSHAFRRGNITELLTELEIPERIVGARVGHLSQGTTLGVYCKVKVDSDKKWVPAIEKWLYEGEL